MEINKQPNMTNTVELTPAELEMIKVKREQEALAKKEAEAKKAVQLEKDIKAKEEYIAKTQKQDAEQVAAAKEFAKELGGMYNLVIDQCNDKVKITGEYLNPEDPKANSYEREVLWSKTYARQTAKITRGEWTVTVSDHVTYSSKWNSRGTSQGYKMQLHGPEMGSNNRHYTRTSKVNELIKDAIDAIDARKKHEQAKKSALQSTLDKMQKQYPDAKVTTGYDFEKYHSSKYGLGTKFDTVSITFANGVCIVYRVYSDGSLGRLSLSFPKQADAWSLMEKISQMNF